MLSSSTRCPSCPSVLTPRRFSSWAFRGCDPVNPGAGGSTPLVIHQSGCIS